MVVVVVVAVVDWTDEMGIMRTDVGEGLPVEAIELPEPVVLVGEEVIDGHDVDADETKMVDGEVSAWLATLSISVDWDDGGKFSSGGSVVACAGGAEGEAFWPGTGSRSADFGWKSPGNLCERKCSMCSTRSSRVDS